MAQKRRPAHFAFPEEAKPLSEAVVGVIEAIEADIIRGVLLPGVRMIEDHLMEDYGAKRHTVRAALEELERLGVVEKPRHHGAQLRRFSEAAIRDLYSVRETLHRAAVRAMVEHHSHDLAKVRFWFDRHSDAARQDDVVAIHRSNMMFHASLFELSRNPFLTSTIRTYDWISFPIRAYGVSDKDALHRACSEHAQMIECLEAGRYDELELLTVDHMAQARTLYAAKFSLPDRNDRRSVNMRRQDRPA